MQSRNSVTITVTRLQDGQKGLNTSKRMEIFLLQNIWTGFGADPASYLMNTGVLFTRVKQQENKDNHLLPSSREVKNEC
jgi:hypothetical protein